MTESPLPPLSPGGLSASLSIACGCVGRQSPRAKQMDQPLALAGIETVTDPKSSPRSSILSNPDGVVILDSASEEEVAEDIAASVVTNSLVKEAVIESATHQTPVYPGMNGSTSRRSIQQAIFDPEENAGCALGHQCTVREAEVLDAEEGPKIIMGGRFELMMDELGRGGFCVVRSGRDVRTGRAVAIKSYHSQFLNSEVAAEVEHKFFHEVEIFKSLGLMSSAPRRMSVQGRNLDQSSKMLHNRVGGDRQSFCLTPLARGLLVQCPVVDCFNNLIAYSTNNVGKPGKDLDGHFYTVLEMAEYTLEEFLFAKNQKGAVVSMPDIFVITRAMAESLAWIHALGMVHLDVKPSNFMFFADRWKMIDMDGVQNSSSTKPVDAFYTPLYASPELAQAVVCGANIRLSRTMDVWSFGITLLDVLCTSTAMADTYAGFQTQALFDSDESAQTAFLRFLADDSQTWVWSKDVDVPHKEALNNRMLCGLLDNVLVKDPSKRLSASELLTHPFICTKTVVAKGELHVADDLRHLRSDCSERRPSSMQAANTYHKMIKMPSLLRIEEDKKEEDSVKLEITRDVSVSCGALTSSWLQKRGPTITYKWTNYYCVLTVKELKFYADEQSARKKGSINITSATCVVPFIDHDCGDAVKHAKDRPFGFVVDTNPGGGPQRRLFYFDGGSEELVYRWKDAVEQSAALRTF